MTFAELLRATTYFPGELEAIEHELCGGRPIGLLHLPQVKRERLAAWLRFPTERRAAAYAAAAPGAYAPIAAALDRLRDPEKYVRKASKSRTAAAQDLTFDAIEAFLAEDDTP